MVRTLFSLAFVITLLQFPVAHAASINCEDLDHAQCIGNSECILDYLDRESAQVTYRCRVRRAPCEVNLPPGDLKLREAECQRRVGCRMSGNCYCGCDDRKNSKYHTCDCECGRGLPPDCRVVP